MSFGARALIRLGALEHNLSVIRAAAPNSKVMAVIKANAYGHGMLAVAKALVNVDALAVARVAEAVALREAGSRQRLVLLAGVLDAEELRVAIDNDLDLVVHCKEQLRLLAGEASGQIDVWLKLDTGMNRLGFSPRQSSKILSELSSLSVVRDVKYMTHLSSADDLKATTTDQQMLEFRAAVSDFEGDISIANTSAALRWSGTTQMRCGGENWIRPGIALFGISPFTDISAADLGLRPVMHFEAKLIAVKALQKGAHVGYKSAYQAPEESTLGIIAAGYGDGYSRHFRSGTPVLINGRKVPLVGNVSMDMIAVDLGADANDQVGDVATLWGDGLPAEEVAPWADAIPYELVCGILNREDSELID